jgi:hypothetical protein
MSWEFANGIILPALPGGSPGDREPFIRSPAWIPTVRQAGKPAPRCPTGPGFDPCSPPLVTFVGADQRAPASSR